MFLATTEEIVKHFGFRKEYDFNIWRNTLKPDFRFDGVGALLYTDGDSGAMLFSWSEVFEEDGLSMRLVECNYCDIKLSSLKEIRKIFKQRSFCHE